MDYEALPAVASTKAAAATSAPLIYEELDSNVAWQGHVAYGDVDGAFQRADRVVRENLRIHRYSSTPLEPFACLVEHTPERLTIWCNSQSPDVIYDAITEALGVENVRVIVPDVGGGFGQKIHLIRKYAVLTALMAVQTGRPVKWIEDRSEHMRLADMPVSRSSTSKRRSRRMAKCWDSRFSTPTTSAGRSVR